MPLLLHTSSSSFNTKVITAVIAGVFTVATAVVFTVPSISHFVVSSFPIIIYDNTVFLLKPPYLYLVINCIIVSIVATSKLTHHKSSSSVDDSEISGLVVTPVLVPVQLPPSSDIDTGFLNVVHDASDYTGFVEKTDPPVDQTVEESLKFPGVVPEIQKTEMSKPSSDSPEPEKVKPKYDSPEISILKHSTRKPPRVNQQKPLKSSSEGGSKKSAALGVTKPPRRQDTLETTWKKITEGRSTPLTKHLTKSDTWQERGHVPENKKKKKEKMTKSENLNATAEEKLLLKREPSPGQEELNRRVEAFIKKFNEEMRLQRLESLAKYNEMVNGGTRL
ncbi:hypothetical protein CARUB_v10027772mg [Capsella rubella]|uniref:DUF4408 domain-containing protein n=1 Tax=Capsella rubella TaxID=81985 RepID=R0GQD0_9BRAS|nr:uncharacterized protein LOC17876681 [Capsella rubella]EOA14540.1 hypothetical protein CARUB_v10027772mg [Capsella rubella]